MNNRDLSVVWTDYTKDYEQVVRGASEALSLVLKLQAELVVPAVVEFYNSDSLSAFSLAVGRELTVATFDETVDGAYFVSLGDVAESGTIAFCHGNSEIDYSAVNAVPFADGLEALRFFVEHRTRPTNLEWEEV